MMDDTNQNPHHRHLANTSNVYVGAYVGNAKVAGIAYDYLYKVQTLRVNREQTVINKLITMKSKFHHCNASLYSRTSKVANRFHSVHSNVKH
jgi:hypothetical protein